MKINKQALLDALDEAEQNQQDAIDEFLDAREKYNKDRWAEWKLVELPKFQALRDLISAAAKARRPITREEALRCFPTASRYSSGNNIEMPFWHPAPEITQFVYDGKQYKGIPVINRNIKSLRALIETFSEDTVSSSALATMGYRDLEWLFRAANPS